MNKTTHQLSEIKKTGTVSGTQPDVEIDFFSKNGFDLACRIAKAFATSDAVPESFRQFNEKKEKNGDITFVENPAAMGNCLVAIEVSKSVGLSMVSVMQNADVIKGKLRWSSKFQIAAVNASGRFSPLKFKLTNLGRIKTKYRERQDWNKELKRYNFVENEVEIDNWECIAWAYELDENGRMTKEIVQSIPVTMQMAVEEGWYSKNESKWQGSMRFQMLQYRAGTFFASIYAPDVIMGMGRSSEESADIIDVLEQKDGSFSANSANNVTLQDLKSSPDVGSISTDGVDRDTGEITGEPQQIEQDKPDIKAEEIQAKSDEPTPEEQAAIQKQLIAEAEAEKSAGEKRSRQNFSVE
jgi:hypothetical protein